MKKPYHATLTAEGATDSQIKEVVNRMFSDGEVEIEMDDAHIKKEIADMAVKVNREISEVRRDFGSNIRTVTQDAQKLNAETKKDISTVVGAIVTDVNNLVTNVKTKLLEIDKKVEEAVRNSGKSATVFDEAKIAAIADSTFQSLLTKAIAKQANDGDVTALPALKQVDPFFVENAQTTRIGRAITQRRHLMASGPSGSGKTFPIEQMLRKHGRRYVKVSVADGLGMQEFLARANVRSTKAGTETFYTYGFLPLTMKAGIPLVLDEIDKVQSEVVSILNAALEHREIYVPQTGELIRAGKDWQVFMTCNSLRDSTGNYGGYRVDAALLNRLVFGKADYLTVQEESGILTRCGLATKDANAIVQMMQGLRASYYAGKLTQAPSTRLAVRIARCLLGQDDDGAACDKPMRLIEAIEYCFLDGLPDNEASEALVVIKNGI